MKTAYLSLGLTRTLHLFFPAMAWALAWGLTAERAAGQGTIFSTLRTGGGPLTTATQTFAADTLQPGYQLNFAFGFATEERSGPGQFFDSATVTLQDVAGAATVVYLTVDANGVAWAPTTPGGVAINPASFVATPLAYRDTSQPWAYQTAYSMVVPVPSQFAGATVNLHLDLFDNGNALGSLAWISQVPEPGCGALGLLAGMMWLWRRRMHR